MQPQNVDQARRLDNFGGMQKPVPSCSVFGKTVRRRLLKGAPAERLSQPSSMYLAATEQHASAAGLNQ